MFILDNKEQLTTDILISFLKEHMQKAKRYKELENMYKNKYKILEDDHVDNFKPNNKIVVNYAKYIVDTFNGFFMGIPVKTTSDNEKINDYIQTLEKNNNIDDNNSELSKKCSIYGHAYELLFLDENAEVGITYIDPQECFIIYDNSIRQKPLFGVRYGKNKDNELFGTISDDEHIMYFETKDDNLYFTETKTNFFGAVPIIEYLENEERMGMFESVETLINSYNKAISEKANDVDYFADAYLVITGARLDEEKIRGIRRNRIINFPGIGNIEIKFLEKPNADVTQENLINRLERLIFNISMTPNINDENFGTSSGIALKYKLQSMGNLANNKERKFVKGFNKRFELISRLPNTIIKDSDLVDINYIFTRNIPQNTKDEIEIAQGLNTLVSQETTLANLSCVDDVKKEIERIKEEEKQVDVYDE